MQNCDVRTSTDVAAPEKDIDLSCIIEESSITVLKPKVPEMSKD